MFFQLPAQVLLASSVLSISIPPTIHLAQRTSHKPNNSSANRGPAKPHNNTKFVSEPLNDLFVGTDLQWYGNIGFGTPPQTFQAVFDTGSFDTAIPGIMCALPCINQRQFDYTMSSTFINMRETKAIQFSRGLGGSQSLNVLKVKDTMMLLGMPVPQTTFYLITNQTFGFFGNLYDGIVGLGFDPDSEIYNALRHNGFPALFSMYLTPRRIGGAELILGGINETKSRNAELLWAPIINTKNKRKTWSLSASQIYVNGHLLQKDLYVNKPMTFDSSVSNVILSPKLTAAVYAHISPRITSVGAGGAFGLPCSEIPGISSAITFTFISTAGHPFNLTIPSNEFSVGRFADNPSLCQTFINSMDIEGAMIGGSLLKHYYSVWDVDHARIGFKHNGF